LIKKTDLDDYNALLERASGSEFKLDKGIGDTRKEFGETVRNLEEGGATALGPALLVAVGIASKTPGTKVIICTDGLANVGIGSLNMASKSGTDDFYSQVGQYAKRKGVVISVTTIQGCDTKLEKLGALADLTRGSVDIVDPETMDLSGVVSTKTLATQVRLNVFVGGDWGLNGVKKDEIGEDDKSKKGELVTKVTKELGNATQETQVAYELRTNITGLSTSSGTPESGKKKKKEKDKKLPAVPVQVQIHYNKLDGSKCLRVWTSLVPVSDTMDDVKKGMDITVISTRLAQLSAQMARDGDYEGALSNATKVKDMLVNAGYAQGDLWELFMKEYNAISTDLGAAINFEKNKFKAGTATAVDRSELRSDYTAQKLYSYSGSSKAGCCVQ